MEPSPLISDALWAQLAPVMVDASPRRGRHGGGRHGGDRRGTLEAIAWKYRHACAWHDLPARFGHWSGVYRRHRRWAREGTYDRLVAAATAAEHAEAGLGWLVAAGVPPRRTARAGR